MLAIPIEVVCDDILPHLSVCDLQALDTAYTNTSLRPKLGEVWKSYMYSSSEVLNRQEFCWLCDIGVRFVAMSAAFNYGSLCETISSNIRTLKYFHATGLVPDDILLQIAANCSDLEVLRVGTCAVHALDAVILHCHRLHTIAWSERLDTHMQLVCTHCPHILHISHRGSCSDASLEAIANTFPHLQSFELQGSAISEDTLIYLATHCRVLKSLSFRGGTVNISGVAAFWSSNLLEIDLSKNEDVINDVIEEMAQCCPQLQKLSISSCEMISDDAVIAVAEHCPQLRVLDISYCDISDLSLIALGQHCYELKSINISFRTNFTDVGIAALASGCPLLQEFSASTTNITDAAVVALARGCRELRKINLAVCKSITLKGISTIVQHCPLISDLRLSHCNVTDDFMYEIAKHCRNLTVLDISCTYMSNPEALRRVITSCRLLQGVSCTSCFWNKDLKDQVLRMNSRLKYLRL